MKIIFKSAVLGAAFMVFSLSAFSQAVWTDWKTVYHEGGSLIEISFKLNPCKNGTIVNSFASYYRYRTNFSRSKTDCQFSFDFVSCEGKTKTELITVSMEKPVLKEWNQGQWFMGDRVIKINVIKITDRSPKPKSVTSNDLEKKTDEIGKRDLNTANQTPFKLVVNNGQETVSGGVNTQIQQQTTAQSRQENLNSNEAKASIIEFTEKYLINKKKLAEDPLAAASWEFSKKSYLSDNKTEQQINSIASGIFGLASVIFSSKQEPLELSEEAKKKIAEAKELDKKLAKPYIELMRTKLNEYADTIGAIKVWEYGIKEQSDNFDLISEGANLYFKNDTAQSDFLKYKLSKNQTSNLDDQLILGYIYFSKGLNLLSQRDHITDNKEDKKYKHFTNKADIMLTIGLKHFLNVLAIDSKNESVLTKLKQIYAFKGDAKNYDKTKKKLDAISKN